MDASTVTFVISALKLVGYGLGAIGPGIGIGIACYGCCVATARQPELQGRLFTDFIIGAAMAEALALIGFVLTFIL
ncbi:MAG: ATP synthase F0 subunit C [Eggerthellaceae bacterium]|nr:ATP synthase F0 subunit C [Eggerthellaceae bacterium]